MYPARMNTLRAAVAVLSILVLASCGGSDSGGRGGSGGSGGSAGTAGATAGTGGNASGGRGGAPPTGSAGATGTAGAGGATGSCTSCVACVNSNCAAGVSQCMANTDCKALYDCVAMCTISINSCAQMHVAAATTFATTVSSCFTNSCRTQCTY